MDEVVSYRDRILVIEDEQSMRAGIRHSLEREGYRVLEADDGDVGLRKALREKPGLVVVDMLIPKLSGIEVASALRRYGLSTPILMISTCPQVPSRVRGLLSGADDYLSKPFDSDEFIARVQGLLRGRVAMQKMPNRLRMGRLRIDLDRREAWRGDEPLALTKTEFSILRQLAANMGAPVSRDTLLDRVWGYNYFPSTRTVDTHVYRLRQKLGDAGKKPRWIRKLYGEGYILNCEQE